ncbi:MAG: hypothetical protein ACI81L_003592, partial [Verrucomicrobiales bacterium]
GRVMFLTIDRAAWDVNPASKPSSTEAVGTEIRIHLSSLNDLAAVWTRAISTMMSSGGAR